MKKWFALAAAGLLLFGASAVKAAPVIVTYSLAECTDCVRYLGNPLPGVPVVTGVGAGSTLTVAFTSGAPTLGGSLGSFGQIAALGLQFSPPIDAVVQTIPGMIGLNGLGIAAFPPAFLGSGATGISAGALGGGVPPYDQVGNANATLNIAGGFLTLRAFGNQVIGPGVPVVGSLSNVWTLGILSAGLNAVTGIEVDRQVVPEPATGAMLLVGLAGVAGLGGVARRART